MALPASAWLEDCSYKKSLPHLKWKTGVPKGPRPSQELRELPAFGESTAQSPGVTDRRLQRKSPSPSPD